MHEKAEAKMTAHLEEFIERLVRIAGVERNDMDTSRLISICNLFILTKEQACYIGRELVTYITGPNPSVTHAQLATNWLSDERNNKLFDKETLKISEEAKKRLPCTLHRPQ